MNKEEFLIEEEEENQRIDKFVHSKFSQFSRTDVQNWIKNSKVLLNSSPCKSKELLKENDHIICFVPSLEELKITGDDIPLDILYEDDDLLIINKQSPLIVHPTSNIKNDTLVNGLLFHRKEIFTKLQDHFPDRPGIVHRIDKETTGLIIINKTLISYHKLKAAFKKRLIKKTYLAIVRGKVSLTNETIHTFLGKNPRRRTQMAVLKDGKDAITHYKGLAHNEDISLVKLRLETGRTHQIRVHMAHIGHTIYGDKVYSKNIPQEMQDCPSSHLLHAWKLEFKHPITHKIINIKAPLPETFLKVCQDNDINIVQ